MSLSYFAHISPSESGLEAFRDAAITYAACRRNGGVLTVDASDKAQDLLTWLGIEFVPGRSNGIAYLDPARSIAEADVRALPAWGELPSPDLDTLRQRGYVAETIFAALIRSSYGPADSLEFFPTRSELGFYFEDGQILPGQARWDSEYLEACQSFFMEELMPAELVAKSLSSLPWGKRESLIARSSKWEDELHGVTFLVAGELQSLAPLARLLSGLLDSDSPAPALDGLLSGLKDWNPESWQSAWAALPQGSRHALAEHLCAGFTEQAEAVLFTAGPELLAWRAGSGLEQTPAPAVLIDAHGATR